MRKYETSSSFAWICEGRNKKIVRKYKRKGLRGHPRTISLKNIYEVLKDVEIPHPIFLKNRIKYIEEEFIESTEKIENIDREKIINTTIDYIEIMYNTNCQRIKKYITWNNNSEYLCFQVNHLKKVLKDRKCQNLAENYKTLDNFIKKLDDNRKLSLIHGDISANNMIFNNKKIYLIDWEFATYGDIAYELAMHFLLMKYNQDEKIYFVDNLCKRINVDKNNLLHDIDIYNQFENFRINI